MFPYRLLPSSWCPVQAVGRVRELLGGDVHVQLLLEGVWQLVTCREQRWVWVQGMEHVTRSPQMPRSHSEAREGFKEALVQLCRGRQGQASREGGGLQQEV